MNRTKLSSVGVIVMILGGVGGIYGLYSYYGAGSTDAACPSIFATVSFQNASGFVTVAHPSSQVIEFVLAPNTTGRVDAVYSSPTNNLSETEFTGSVPAWPVSSTGTSTQSSSIVNVLPTGVDNNGPHQLTVYYTMAAGSSESLYLLGFPSTCRSVYLNVGHSQYSGSLG
jgi:hypothetical protein